MKVFYAEARNKDGGTYRRSTLLGFRNGIERYLNNPPFNRGIHLATDARFQQSNQMLTAKLKNTKQNGEENIKQKPAISLEDLKELSVAAGLCQVYTNHCVRATAITLWSDAGLSNRHIMTISGHRNENSLKSYNTRPSSAQLQICSNVISHALSAQPTGQLQLHPSNNHIGGYLVSADQSRAQAQNIFARHEERVNFATMFSGCKIGQINVSFGRDFTSE